MYKVTLHALGNPDHGQYAPVAPSKTVEAPDLAGISRAAREYIDANDLGGGNFAPGTITKDGEEIGRVSYNGRIWPPGEWTRDMQPIFEPGREG